MGYPLKTEEPDCTCGKQKRQSVWFNLSLPEDIDLKKELNERLYSYVTWTEDHAVESEKYCIEMDSFSFALKSKIKGSSVAPFIEEFNIHRKFNDKNEQELNLAVLKAILVERKQPELYDQENDFVDDLFGLVNRLVEEAPSGWLTYQQLCGSLKHLRLIDAKVGQMDVNLRGIMVSLEWLILSGNLLRHFSLSALPRCLRYAELYRNSLRTVEAADPPPQLYHLGLGYNALSDRSTLRVLSIQSLVSLDLSDNDITDLTSLMPALSALPLLTSLSLIGNPCSVSVGYALRISTDIPKLKYLDSELIERKKKSGHASQDLHLTSAKLRIFVFRIMGLPKPPNTTGVRKYYEVETCFPLLDTFLKRHIIQEICEGGRESQDISQEETQVATTTTQVQNKPQKASTRESGDRTKTDSISKPDPLVVVSLLQRYLEQDVLLVGVNYLKSKNKVKWNQIMKFKGPVFELEVDEKDFLFLRDTLRTLITLKVYYIEEPIRKKKKEESKTERISKLVAKVPLPAEVINWKQSHISYSWEATKPCLAQKCPGIEVERFQKHLPFRNIQFVMLALLCRGYKQDYKNSMELHL